MNTPRQDPMAAVALLASIQYNSSIRGCFLSPICFMLRFGIDLLRRDQRPAVTAVWERLPSLPCLRLYRYQRTRH